MSRDDTHLDILGGDDCGADGLVAHVAHVVVGLDAPGAESPLDRDTLPLMDWLLIEKSCMSQGREVIPVIEKRRRQGMSYISVNFNRLRVNRP